MRKIGQNHHTPDGFELFMDAEDESGQTYKFCVCSIQDGQKLFFDKLTDIRIWKRKVEDERLKAKGLSTLKERIESAINSQDIDEELGQKMIKYAYGETT